MAHPQHTEREVYVDRGGPGAGAIIAVLVALVVIVLLGWMLFFGGDGDTDVVPGDTDVNIEEVDPGTDDGGDTIIEGDTTQDTTDTTDTQDTTDSQDTSDTSQDTGDTTDTTDTTDETSTTG